MQSLKNYLSVIPFPLEMDKCSEMQFCLAFFFSIIIFGYMHFNTVIEQLSFGDPFSA